MEAVKVGIREFREKLASYLLEADTPVAITRHGDTVGYYIPARRKRSEAERTALKEAASRRRKIRQRVSPKKKSFRISSGGGPAGVDDLSQKGWS